MESWDKTQICFTWDDNFIRHYTLIAPLFEKYGYRCTFFINSDDEDLNEFLTVKYKDLYNRGFEIGNHGHKHINMQNLNDEEFAYSIEESQKQLLKKIGVTPCTFAFPYHKYSDRLLDIAKKMFVETRNTLLDSFRYSLKTKTTADDMLNALKKAICQKKIMVVSGHSVITNQEKELEFFQGYEPVIYEELELFLSKLYSYSVDVETFYTIAKRKK